jgi:hypothetical protein
MTMAELKLKAALKQAAIDLCDGHIWGDVYFSKISYQSGGSVVCLRCGERRAWNQISGIGMENREPRITE